MPPCRTPALHPIAVDDVEHPAQSTLGLDVVWKPPYGLEAAAVGIEVLDLHALVQAVLRARAPEAGSLHPTPRSLAHCEGVAEVVHPVHAGIDSPRDPVGLCKIARPHARGEPELGRIRTADGLVLVVERLNAHNWAEDLLVGKGAANHHRLEEPAVAVRSPCGCQSLDVLALALGDQGTDLVAERKSPGALFEPARELVVDGSLDIDALRAHAGLTRVD